MFPINKPLVTGDARLGRDQDLPVMKARKNPCSDACVVLPGNYMEITRPENTRELRHETRNDSADRIEPVKDFRPR